MTYLIPPTDIPTRELVAVHTIPVPFYVDCRTELLDWFDIIRLPNLYIHPACQPPDFGQCPRGGGWANIIEYDDGSTEVASVHAEKGNAGT